MTEPYTLCIASCICLDFSKLVSPCNNVGWICYISALREFEGEGVSWRCSVLYCNPSSMRERLSYRSRIQREVKRGRVMMDRGVRWRDGLERKYEKENSASVLSADYSKCCVNVGGMQLNTTVSIEMFVTIK